MNCVVLGGSGFIGSHLCDALLSDGCQVTVYDRFHRQHDGMEDSSTNYRFISGDFCHEKDFARLLNGIDVVFHLISTTTPRTSNNDMTGDLADNVLPTIRLLDACRQVRLTRFFFLSSGGTVYGNPRYLPIDEEHPTNPICAYGIHKLAIEKYLLLYSHLYDLKVTILRAANPYGPRQNPFGSQGVVSSFLARSLMDEALEIWGDGSIVRDFLHVKDLVRAMILAMHYSGNINVFNVGAGCGVSLNDLVSLLENVLNRRLIVKYKDANKLDVSSNVLDISRIQTELGWMPKIDLQQGLRELSQEWLPEKKCFGI